VPNKLEFDIQFALCKWWLEPDMQKRTSPVLRGGKGVVRLNTYPTNKDKKTMTKELRLKRN